MTEQAPIDSPYVLRDKIDHTMWLTLNRPGQRNALSSRMITVLKAAIEEANSDPSVRVIVISSTGPIFSAGHDLREMCLWEGETIEERKVRVREVLRKCSQLMLAIVHSPKAIVASVQATATAAGCQLVSACDMAITTDEAKFCMPGVNIGIFCTTPLVGVGRNIHRKHAMEMALTGDLFSAQDAVRFGLVNYAVPAKALKARTQELAEKIASRSVQGIRAGKEAFYKQIDMPIEQAFEYANESMVDTMLSPDAAEGSLAFFEKRPPQWKDA